MPSIVSDRSARAFRLYAESLGQDLKAIAACAREPRRGGAEEAARAVRNETLGIAGERDDLAGGPRGLAALMIVTPYRFWSSAKILRVRPSTCLSARVMSQYNAVMICFLKIRCRLPSCLGAASAPLICR